MTLRKYLEKELSDCAFEGDDRSFTITSNECDITEKTIVRLVRKFMRERGLRSHHGKIDPIGGMDLRPRKKGARPTHSLHISVHWKIRAVVSIATI